LSEVWLLNFLRTSIYIYTYIHICIWLYKYHIYQLVILCSDLVNFHLQFFKGPVNRSIARYDYIYQLNWPGPRVYSPATEVQEGLQMSQKFYRDMSWNSSVAHK
jgi:hypothetical protein